MLFKKKHVHDWSKWKTVGKINVLGTNAICGALQVRQCKTCNQLEFEERKHRPIQPSQILYYPESDELTSNNLEQENE